MRLPSSIAAKIREGFVLYASGDLDKDSPLFEIVHVAHSYYAGNTDLAQAMVLRDIERNYEELGVYKSSFSYRKYPGCERAREKASLGKVVPKLIASLARSDYVELTFP